MDKAQALYQFWSSFGLPAYDENTVPDDATLPYITYNTATDSVGNIVPLTGSVWYRGMSWAEVEAKAGQVASRIGYGYAIYKLDNGYMWITKGMPFAARVVDGSDSMIRRIYINILAEFLTAS